MQDPAPTSPALSLSNTVLAGTDADCATATEGIDELVSAAVASPVTYCFTVTNTGDTALADIVLTNSALGLVGTAALTSPGPIAPGESVIMAFNAAVDATLDNTAETTATPVDADGNVIPLLTALTATNTSGVEATAPDPDAPAITLSNTVLPGVDADCSTATEGTNELVVDEPGSPVTYCFLVLNSGGTSLVDVILTNPVLGLVGPDALAVTGPLAPGDAASGSVNGTIATNLDNTAFVTATPSDQAGNPIPDATPPQSNNVSAVGVILQTSADLALAKEVVAPGVVGDRIRFSLVVTNNGPNVATNVAVSDPLPTGLMFSGAFDDSWTCVTNNGALGCSIGSLAAGASATLVIDTTIGANLGGQTMVNRASVSSDQDDPNTNNNSAEVSFVLPSGNQPVNPVAPPRPVLPFTGSARTIDLIAYSSIFVAAGLLMSVGLQLMAERRQALRV